MPSIAAPEKSKPLFPTPPLCIVRRNDRELAWAPSRRCYMRVLYRYCIEVHAYVFSVSLSLVASEDRETHPGQSADWGMQETGGAEPS
jgi:hypothetical protein